MKMVKDRAMMVWHWLKNHVRWKKSRIVAGILFFILELYLFLGTGIMGEEITHFHTGEGAYEVVLSEERNTLSQSFKPVYKKISVISFLADMEAVTKKDGLVKVSIINEKEQVVFEKTMLYSDLNDGSFTDVETNLVVRPGKLYTLVLSAAPSSAGEYICIDVCDKSYYIPENKSLYQGEEEVSEQLVSRYRYVDVILGSKVRNVLVICILTALGIMIGLPCHQGIRYMMAAFLFLAGPYLLGSRLELLAYKEIFYLPFAMKWNVGILYAAEVIFLLLTQSPWLSICLVNVGATLLYVANYYVLMYRGKPLHMYDFSAIGTAAKVVGDYQFEVNAHMLMVWAILTLILVYAVQTRVKHKPYSKKGKLVRMVSYVITISLGICSIIAGGHLLIGTDLLEKQGFIYTEFQGWFQDEIYYADGYLVGTCLDIKNSKIVPPEGYSQEKVAEILQLQVEKGAGRKLSETEQQELPHVILIMNESFSDLRVLGDLKLNQENMKFFNSLQENTIRGWTNSSVLGGGTANSEFEVFTGCSMALLPSGFYPYQQGIRSQIPSLVSQMQNYGYTTISMHPEAPSNWNRSVVYRYMKYDHSFWKKDFAGAEVIHRGVSDEETYKKIIDLYENRKDGEKLFVFDLTMQNHGDYLGKGGPYLVQSQKFQSEPLNEYLSLIQISDNALEELVSYFEKQDEKVIICMYGDHQPWLSNLIIPGSSLTPDSDAEKRFAKYKSPFVIWANYDIEEADSLDISLNYLGGMVMQVAGVPLSPYFSYLQELREDYPIITVNGYIDSQNVYRNWENNGNEFPEYQMLQYNYLFDKHSVEWGY